MRKGVIESIYHNFKLKCVNSYGLVFPEYISEFANQLKACRQDSHVLVCLSTDTLIWVNGKEMKMKDAPKEFITRAYDEINKKFVDGQATKINRGKRRVYKIKLKDGKEIVATADHKWLTDKGWKKTIDLNKDSHILTYGIENEHI